MVDKKEQLNIKLSEGTVTALRLFGTLIRKSQAEVVELALQSYMKDHDAWNKLHKLSMGKLRPTKSKGELARDTLQCDLSQVFLGLFIQVDGMDTGPGSLITKAIAARLYVTMHREMMSLNDRRGKDLLAKDGHGDYFRVLSGRFMKTVEDELTEYKPKTALPKAYTDLVYVVCEVLALITIGAAFDVVPELRTNEGPQEITLTVDLDLIDRHSVVMLIRNELCSCVKNILTASTYKCLVDIKRDKFL